MLYLNLEAHGVRFILPAAKVDSVIAVARISPVEGGGRELVGVMTRSMKKTVIPVIDLGIVIADKASAETLGTRIVVTEVTVGAGLRVLVGIKAEGIVNLSKELEPVQADKPGTTFLRDREGVIYSVLDLGSLLSEKTLRFLVTEFSHG